MMSPLWNMILCCFLVVRHVFLLAGACAKSIGTTAEVVRTAYCDSLGDITGVSDLDEQSHGLLFQPCE